MAAYSDNIFVVHKYGMNTTGYEPLRFYTVFNLLKFGRMPIWESVIY